MAKSAMAPNIISAYKVAQICTFIIDKVLFFIFYAYLCK